MDLSEKIELIYKQLLKDTSPEEASKLVSGIIQSIINDLSREGREISSMALHKGIDDIFQVALSNSKKSVA
jgi:hypothetical protein